MPVPDFILTALAPFGAAFTLPTWQKVLILVLGTLLARGRRTITAALRITGRGQDPHFSRFHQVFNRAAWSPLHLSRILLGLIRDALIIFDQGLILVLDETLERRRGPTIRTRGHHRDPIASSRTVDVFSSGLRWIVLAVVVTVPWTHTPWALPLMCVLAPSQKVDDRLKRRHRTLTQWAELLLRVLRRWVPALPLTLLVDSSYSSIAFAMTCHQRDIRLIAPLPLNACLFEPVPPPIPGQKRGRGQPPQKGPRLPRLGTLTTVPDQVWQEAELRWHDGTTRRLRLASGMAWWYHSRTERVWVRWVVSVDPKGRWETRAYFSTCVADAPEWIVQTYLKRWTIETTFEESRCHLGVETQRQWSDRAIARETPCLFGLYSVVALLGRELHAAGKLRVQATAWYRKEEPTFSDVLAAIRRECWGFGNTCEGAKPPDLRNRTDSDWEWLMDAVCSTH
jgi:DDE superfamily endonuclease